MRFLHKLSPKWHLTWLLFMATSALLTTNLLFDSRGPYMPATTCFAYFALAWGAVVLAWFGHRGFLHAETRKCTFTVFWILLVGVTLFYNRFLACPPLPGESQYKELRLAIYKHDLGEAQTILASDTNPDYLPPDSRMPRQLVLASAYGELDIARLLIEHGASTADVGDRLLRQAAQHGDVALIETLVRHGVPIDETWGSCSSFALWKAVQHDKADAVRCLLAHGANSRAVGASPADCHSIWSVLHLARSRGNAAIVKLL